MSQSLFFFFSNISTLVFSLWADTHGRKKTLFYTYFIGASFSLIAAFS
jgi:MFS family permease